MGSLPLPPPQRWRALVYLLRARPARGSYPLPLIPPPAGRPGSLLFVYLHDNVSVGTQTAKCPVPGPDRIQARHHAGRPARQRDGPANEASRPACGPRFHKLYGLQEVICD